MMQATHTKRQTASRGSELDSTKNRVAASISDQIFKGCAGSMARIGDTCASKIVQRVMGIDTLRKKGWNETYREL